MNQYPLDRCVNVLTIDSSNEYFALNPKESIILFVFSGALFWDELTIISDLSLEVI
jgi:hypothetical protein